MPTVKDKLETVNGFTAEEQEAIEQNLLEIEEANRPTIKYDEEFKRKTRERLNQKYTTSQ